MQHQSGVNDAYRQVRRSLTVAVQIIALVSMYPAGSWGQTWAHTDPVPEYVSFQGSLYHASDGTTPIDEPQDIEFRLYQQEAAPVNAAVWGERHRSVSVFNGTFNVYLGNGAAIEGVPREALSEVFKAAPLWLGVKVGLDDEMVPRQKVTTAPSALTATHATTAKHGVPPGTVVMFAGGTVPDGWLPCDGTAYAKTDYAALYAAVEDTWGGTLTTFNVPDFRNRIPIGAGFGINANTVATHGATAKLSSPGVAGATKGLETHLLALTEIPPHDHQYVDTWRSGTEDNLWGAWNGANENSHHEVSHTTNASGGGLVHNNVQPTAYVQYIIKY